MVCFRRGPESEKTFREFCLYNEDLKKVNRQLKNAAITLSEMRKIPYRKLCGGVMMKRSSKKRRMTCFQTTRRFAVQEEKRSGQQN
jgi:hypothetical protein